MENGTSKPDRAALLNIVVLVVVTASMIAFPIRKTWQARNDPHRLAEVRGRVIAQAFDRIAVTNRESAEAILRCVDPTLKLASLPGVTERDGQPGIAWSVVDLAPDASRSAPLLVSRNVRGESLASLTGRVANALSNEPPFGTNCAVIIFRDGRKTTIQGDSLDADWSAFIGAGAPGYRLIRPN